MPVALGALLIPIFAAAGITLSATVATAIGAAVLIGGAIGLGLLAQAFFAPKQPKPSDGQTIIKQSAWPRVRVYGRWKLSGLLVFAASEKGRLHRVLAMASGEIDAIEEHWIDDNLIEIDGSGDVTTAKYIDGGDPRVHVETRLGTASPTVYTALKDAFPGLWTDDHLGKGIAHAYVRLRQVKAEKITEMFPNLAQTNYRWVLRGAKVFDPREVTHDIDDPSTWEWSENAALCILDFLIHDDGMRLPKDWVTNAIEYWEDAADICDEAVTLKAGGTVARWLIGNAYSFAERPADVLSRMLQACDAILFPVPGGGLAIKVGKWEAPTVTITDDDVVGIADLGRGRSILTTANVIRAQYTSRLHDYKETDADPWINNDDVAARGEISADFQYFAVPNHSQCRRLMKLQAHRATPEWTGQIICNLRKLTVLGQRFVHWTSATYGIDADFEIVSPPQFVVVEGSVVRGIQLDLSSLTSAAYDWDAATEEGNAPVEPDEVPDDNTIAPPEDFAAALASVAAGTSTIQVVRLTWAEPEEDFFSVEVRGRATDDPEWHAIPVATDALTADFGPLENAKTYEFEARTVSVTGRFSEWVDSAPPTITATQGLETLVDSDGQEIMDSDLQTILAEAA